MLARGAGCCATFEERVDVLLQAHYFLGRMASAVAETVACGRRRRLYEEAVPEGAERNETPFDAWLDTCRGEGGEAGFDGMKAALHVGLVEHTRKCRCLPASVAFVGCTQGS